MRHVTDTLLPHLTGLRGEIAELREDRSRLRVKVEALEVIAQANENTMNTWEAEAKRLRAENEELRDFLKDSKVQTRYWHEQWENDEATMREVAEEIRWVIREHERDNNMNAWLAELADRLDSPPVAEKP